jgi:hypothetical protein
MLLSGFLSKVLYAYLIFLVRSHPNPQRIDAALALSILPALSQAGTPRAAYEKQANGNGKQL